MLMDCVSPSPIPAEPGTTKTEIASPATTVSLLIKEIASEIPTPSFLPKILFAKPTIKLSASPAQIEPSLMPTECAPQSTITATPGTLSPEPVSAAIMDTFWRVEHATWPPMLTLQTSDAKFGTGPIRFALSAQRIGSSTLIKYVFLSATAAPLMTLLVFVPLVSSDMTSHQDLASSHPPTLPLPPTSAAKPGTGSKVNASNALTSTSKTRIMHAFP